MCGTLFSGNDRQEIPMQDPEPQQDGMRGPGADVS